MTDLIGPHLDHLRARGLSPKTIRSRERLLRCLAQELPHGIDAASTEELEQWLGQKGWARKTRETYWCHMVGFYRWATGGKQPKLDWDPTEDIARPHAPHGLPRPVTDAQLRLALRSLAHPWRRAVLLAAGAGLRASECADCCREHFFDGQVVILGKGGKTRSVPVDMDGPLWADVGHLPAGRLIMHRGHPIDGNALSRWCSHHLTQVGMPEVTLHRFRHWFGTTVQREFKDLRVTQELLGHASPATTAGYAALTDRQRRDAIHTLSAALTDTLKDAA